MVRTLVQRSRILGAAFASALMAVCMAAAGAVATEHAEREPIVLDTTVDPIDRPLVEVQVNGAGPFHFVIDTGANRSSVSRRLVERLGLTPHAQRELNGVVSAEIVDFVSLDTLTAGALEMRDVEAPVIAQPVLAGADGVLGIDALRGMRVAFDFVAETVDVRESGWRRRRERNYTRLPARILPTGLAEVRTRVDRLEVQAIIDTGADSSLGNPSLRRAINPNRWERWRRFDAYVIGVTEDVAHGEIAVVSNVYFGRARLQNVPMFFADLHVFDVWDLEGRPAAVIGMDILQRADALVIDYGSGEVLLDIPSPGQRIITGTGGGSRLRRPGDWD